MSPMQKSRRTTMRDVAAEADVSVSTVSLFLQGEGGVSEHTAQRVAAAIDKLGYVPNPRSKNGRRGALRTSLFGLVMEELSFTAFPEAVYGSIIRAIESCARSHGYGMMVASAVENQIPPMIRDRHVQGVIILGGSPATDQLALELLQQNIPAVLVDATLPGHALNTITPDNTWGAYRAIQHLVELGHRRIAVIEGPPKYRVLTDRLWGALRAAEELLAPIRPEYRQPSISSGYPKKGRREMQRLLDLAEPPTAVFAVSDRAAAGALEASKEAHLRVPDDISLVGFDDDIYSVHAIPPLTTVQFARDQMGNMAMERLVDLIEGEAGPPIQQTVYTRLIIRDSTAPVVDRG